MPKQEYHFTPAAKAALQPHCFIGDARDFERFIHDVLAPRLMKRTKSSGPEWDTYAVVGGKTIPLRAKRAVDGIWFDAEPQPER